MLNELISPNELPAGSDAQTVVQQLQKLIMKHQQKANQMQQSVLQFGGHISVLKGELQELGHMIQAAIENPSRKIKMDLYKTQFDTLNEFSSQLTKQLEEFKKSYLSKDDDDEILEIKNKLFLVFPKDCLTLVEDFQLSEIVAKQNKYDLINQQYQKLLDEYNKVVAAQAQLQFSKKQKELIEKEIQILEDEHQLLEDSCTHFQDLSMNKVQNKDEILDDLNSKYKIMAQKINQETSQFTDQLNESIQSSTKFVESALQDLSKLKVEEVSYHFILVCDESGSMQPYFQDLKDAFKVFIKNLNGGSKENTISVILFESKARLKYQSRAITLDLEIDPQGGGTSFTEAFKQVDYCLGQTSQQQTSVIIFMTDGEDSSGTRYTVDLLKKKYIESPDSKKLLTFVIGFGSGVKADQLKSICQSGNGGQLVRNINGFKFGMYIECLGSNNELQNVFSKISTNLNPIISGNLQKVEIMKKQKENIIQDLQKQSSKINKISNDNLIALNQRTNVIKTKIENDSQEAIKYINQEIEKIKKQKDDLRTKIRIKEEDKKTYVEEILKNENMLKEYIGSDIEEFQKHQDSQNNIIQGDLNSTSSGYGDQNIDESSQNSNNTADDQKKGSYFQFEKQILDSIKKIQETQNNQEDIDKKRFEINENLKAQGIIMQKPDEYIRIRSTILQLDNLINERKKYQLLIQRYLKEISYGASMIEIKFKNLDSDLIDRSMIISEIISETLQQNQIKFKEEDKLMIFINHMIKKYEVTDKDVIKFLIGHISVQNLQPKLDNEKFEQRDIRNFEKIAKKQLAPNLSKLKIKIDKIEQKISKLQEKESEGNLTEKEEQALEKLETDLEKLQDQEQGYDKEIELIDEVATFYAQIRSFFAEKINLKNKFTYIEQMRTAFKSIITVNIPSFQYLLYHIKTVESTNQQQISQKQLLQNNGQGQITSQ